MKLKVSLRLKITIINILVLIVCSVLLTISTSFLGAKSIDLVSFMPTQSISSGIDENTGDILTNESEPSIAKEQAIQEVQAEKEKFIIKSGVYMLGIIFLGGITTYFTTKKSLQGLKNLNKEIREISEHNLSKEIEEEADEEIKGIIKSFNNMLNRINDAFEDQKNFSVNVAHELRTPLAVIQMKIDVFKKRKEKKSEDYEKLIEVIEKNNNRLAKVVDELLTISNKENIEFKDKIEFHEIIEAVINELKEFSLERNIQIFTYEEIKNDIDKEFYGNEQLLYRAIYNLIENAIKYNYDSGYVKIYTNKHENFVSITIKDSGIGIKDKDYDNIFKPFYRVDKSRSRKIGGSGLGLSIVKSIIEKHNGKISIESNDIGTSFTIKLPYN